MRKRLIARFLRFIVFFSFLLTSCEKQEIYDLFPLKVGNEFYYKYEKRDLVANTKGYETWKVITASSQEGIIKYMIERKLNANIQIGSNETLITDLITYLEVTESKSSSIISLWEFDFKRFQSVSQIELIKDGYNSMPSITCMFKADSGLTRYNYYHPPNQVTFITLTLDSLKTFP